MGKDVRALGILLHSRRIEGEVNVVGTIGEYIPG